MGLGKHKEIRNFKRIQKERIEGNFEKILKEEIKQLKVDMLKQLTKAVFDIKVVQRFFSPRYDALFVKSLVKVYELLVHLSESEELTLQVASDKVLQLVGYNEEQRAGRSAQNVGMKLTAAFIDSCSMLYLRGVSVENVDSQVLVNRFTLEALSQLPDSVKRLSTQPLKNMPKEKSLKTLKISGNRALFRAKKQQHHHKVLEAATRLEQVEFQLNNEVKIYLAEKWSDLQPERKGEDMDKWKAVNRIVNRLSILPETFYLKTFYDTRGRIYYDSFINPQQSDEIKGLLQYANGVKLTDRGLDWSFAYMSSLFGKDKLPFESRVNEGKKLLHADWLQAAEPYQFLGFRSEVIRAIENPNHLFKGRIHIDACASGTQFLSALAGDTEGCLLSNVLPSYDAEGHLIRKDIYQYLAERVKNWLEAELLRGVPVGSLNDEDILYINHAVDALANHGRKMGKEVIMTGNYGASKGSIQRNIINIINDIIPDFSELDEFDLSFTDEMKADLDSFVSVAIVDESEGLLKGATALKKYLRHVLGDQVTEWQTPDGFQAVNGGKSSNTHRCYLTVGGERYTAQYRIWDNDRSNHDRSKTKRGIVPNFIHSLDAALLRMTVNKCDFDMTVIHDSYGCHPNNVDEMLLATKQAFIEIIEYDPIKQLTGSSFSLIDKDFSLEKLTDSIWFFS
ncbi:DNA-directed RNA polymerase [Carboxylicivirga sp. RSCT41]|uniref:DNA-directed RNA polymerase n=1 Tax=Carboxylicivirga agarovorans TaxID=3417570 RepID=UPI003D358410